MAETQKRLPTDRREPSRLQRHAPASIKITQSDWKVAIPLLSPLVSPTGNDLTAEIRSCNNINPREVEPDKTKVTAAVFKKWTHPAAPFCYEPPKPFVGLGCGLINS